MISSDLCRFLVFRVGVSHVSVTELSGVAGHCCSRFWKVSALKGFFCVAVCLLYKYFLLLTCFSMFISFPFQENTCMESAVFETQ
jgi:hypothetical protein